MRVRFWGVRGSVPTPLSTHMRYGGNTSCVEVRVPDTPPIILDAGTGIRGLGSALADGGEEVAAHVFLTHFHWDHIQGIPFFEPLYAEGNTLTIHGRAPGVGLRAVLDGQMGRPYFPVDFGALPASVELADIGQEPVPVGRATVRPFPVNHPQGACGFRIEADGVAMVYAPDVEPGDRALDDRLCAEAADADALVFDAHFTPEEYARRRGWGHGTWRDAVRLAADAGVRSLHLFHHAPEHDDRCLERILEQARVEFQDTELAAERRELVLR